MISIEKRNYFFLLTLIIASLLPYFLLTLYIHPAGDDFVYAYNGKHYGLFENAIRDYFQWTGRYVSVFLFVLNPWAFESLTGYRLIAGILILLTFISFYFLTKTIAKNSISKTNLVLCSAVLLLLYLHNMPSLAQGIYWYTGAVIYQGADILALFYISFLILLFQKKYFINQFIHVLICLLLIFIITGFNETIMVILLTIHLLLLTKNRNRLSLLLLIFSILTSMLVIFSPGNEVREAAFPERHQLFHSLLYSAAQTLRFLIKWIFNIPLLIASLLYIRCLEKSFLFKINFYFSPFILTCLLLFVIFLSAFPAYWSTGILGQHRTMNIGYFFFLLLWFINLTAWTEYFKTKKFISVLSNFSTKYFLLLFSLMIFFIIITSNGNIAMKDLLSGKAKRFDTEMKQRYTILKDTRTRSEKICFLDSLLNKPASIFVLDISTNESDWMNRGMAAYFGVKTVKLKK